MDTNCVCWAKLLWVLRDAIARLLSGLLESLGEAPAQAGKDATSESSEARPRCGPANLGFADDRTQSPEILLHLRVGIGQRPGAVSELCTPRRPITLSPRCVEAWSATSNHCWRPGLAIGAGGGDPLTLTMLSCRARRWSRPTPSLRPHTDASRVSQAYPLTCGSMKAQRLAWTRMEPKASRPAVHRGGFCGLGAFVRDAGDLEALSLLQQLYAALKTLPETETRATSAPWLQRLGLTHSSLRAVLPPPPPQPFHSSRFRGFEGVSTLIARLRSYLASSGSAWDPDVVTSTGRAEGQRGRADSECLLEASRLRLKLLPLMDAPSVRRSCSLCLSGLFVARWSVSVC